MNQLKYIWGIPLSNGLALRGSTFSRSAGTNGRDWKRFGNVLVTKNDNDDSTEPNLCSRSYARLIADYSKMIQKKNAVTKLTGESKIRNKGLFSKARFQRLSRVSSLVKIKNVRSTAGNYLCTKSSEKPPFDSNKTNDKTHKSKDGQDKRMTKNESFSYDRVQGKNLAHYLVQRQPESRAISNTIPKCNNDSTSVKKNSCTSANDENKISKTSKTGNIVSKSDSDTIVRNSSFVNKCPCTSVSDMKKLSNASKIKNDITKGTNDTSHHNSLVNKLPGNSTSDPNIVSNKSSATGNCNAKNIRNSTEYYCSFVKKLPDISVNDENIKSSKTSTAGNFNLQNLSNSNESYGSSVKKLSDTSANDANIKADKSSSARKLSPQYFSNTNECSDSSVKKVEDTSASDTNIVLNKSTVAENVDLQNLSNSNERYVSSVKKFPDTSTRDANNVSVVVQRLQKSDNGPIELSTQNSGDSNSMLVTVTESSKSSSISTSSPLRHIDLRINGKPATKVDTVISKVEKLHVVSSAEKVEITIPVLSKTGGAVDDNMRAQSSTINLLIYSQGKQSKGSNDVEYLDKARKIVDLGNTKPGLTRSSTLITTKIKNASKTSDFKSKVIPWWTTEESFRRSKTVIAPLNQSTGITRNVLMKPSLVGKSLTRGNQEVHHRKAKKVAVSDTVKALKFVVTKPSTPRHQQYRRKRVSVSSKIIANQLQKKMSERDEKYRHIREKVTLERSKINEVKPEAKANTKVRSNTSNEPKQKSPIDAIGSTMSVKSDRASTPTLDEVSTKITSSLKSTVAATGVKSMTAEFDTSKELSRNSNLSKAKNIQERFRVKPISVISSGNTNASKGGTIPTKAESKIGTKPPQEVISKSVTKAARQFPRTYGKIRLLPSSQSSAKPAVNRGNNSRCVSVKPNDRTAITGDNKLSMLRNATVTMRPIEKKKDGTLIDYGLTVNTRKKPERKLSGSESTDGLQEKKLMRQKEGAVIAPVKEVMPRRNRDNRSNVITPTLTLDGSDKNNRKTTGETRVSSIITKNTVTKGTTNEPNESTNSRASVRDEKRNSKDSNESQVVETASSDKKLVYSVWLRRFKERTGQDSDPTNDPSSRNS